MNGITQTLKLNNRSGFSLIELIIVMALIGVMAVVVIPMLRQEDLAQERADFVTQLNSFVSGAQYNALVGGKINRVVFDLKKSQVYLQAKGEGQGTDGQDKYELVQVPYNEDVFSWDGEHFKLQAFLVNNKNELAGQDSDKVWFYIVPDGIAQSVIINFYDLASSEKYNETGAYSLVLNPFAVQFKLYESFKQLV